MASVLTSDRLNICQILGVVPLVEARVPQSRCLFVKGSGPRQLAIQYPARYYLRLAGYTSTQVAGALGHLEACDFIFLRCAAACLDVLPEEISHATNSVDLRTSVLHANGRGINEAQYNE